MSIATVASRALAGIDAPEVTVEVHLGPGLPAFHIVGLPDTEVREARDRVRAALNHAHFEFPARRITVNLAPAELPKDSSRFDLPIALGILAASGQLATQALEGQEFAGELSLTGELRSVRGALAMALSARAAGPVIHWLVPSAAAARPSRLCAHFTVTCGRPRRCTSSQDASSSVAATASSPASTSTPASRSRSAPPVDSGLGSGTA